MVASSVLVWLTQRALAMMCVTQVAVQVILDADVSSAGGLMSAGFSVALW